MPESAESALLRAAKQGDLAEVTRLVGLGASTSCRNAVGSTPLHLSIHEQHDGVSKFLIEHGAPIDAKDLEYGATPLLLSAGCASTSTIGLLLLERGADYSASDKEGLLPIHLASSSGKLELLQRLIELGDNVNAVDGATGGYPLHRAAANNHSKCLRLLLRSGADHRLTDHDGWGPLHIAVAFGSLRCSCLLIRAGADINAREKRFFLTPLDLAGQIKHAALAQLLQDRGGVRSPAPGTSVGLSTPKIIIPGRP